MNQNRWLNYNNVEKISKTQRSKRYFSTNYKFKKSNSKSPKNNDKAIGKEKIEILLKNTKKVESTKSKPEKLNKINIKTNTIDEPNDKNIINKEKNNDQNKINTSNKNNKIIVNDEPKGDLNLSEFDKLNQIGKGTFGKIFAVKWKKNGKKYALKMETFTDPEFLEKRKVNSQTSLDNENKNFKENNDTQKHIGENEESVNESIDMEIEIK